MFEDASLVLINHFVVFLVSPTLCEERVVRHRSAELTLQWIYLDIQTLGLVISYLSVPWPLWEGDSCVSTSRLLRCSLCSSSSLMLHWD